MSNVLLTSAGGHGYGSVHFQDTIIKGVKIEKLRGFVNSTIYEKLRKNYPEGLIYAWGVHIGEKGAGKIHFDEFEKGDITLFVDQKKIIALAKTILAVKSLKLGQLLWPDSRPEEAFNGVYFVEKAVLTNIDFQKVIKILNYSEKFHLQGWIFKSDKSAEKLINELELEKYFHTVPKENAVITKEDYEKSIKYLANKPLDQERKANIRTEQTFLRNYLFKNHKVGRCGICGKEYPVDMLVTSHIKKRSECSIDEKLDYENIVMPMCACGCDKAFEEGYIYVDDAGIIRFNESKKKNSGDLYNLFVNIIDKRCPYFNYKTSKYFKARNKSLNIK